MLLSTGPEGDAKILDTNECWKTIPRAKPMRKRNVDVCLGRMVATGFAFMA